jgi:xanthine dehydrogenase YagS FAD-binding subunit
MKALININANSIADAVVAAQQARSNGQSIAFSGGGTDLLQQLKDGTETCDVIINLRNVADADQVSSSGSGTTVGGLITLEELSNSDVSPVLAQAAASVATPQIRNVATLSGNLTQRPWCWYYRNGFSCYKAGGNECFSVVGENQQHAIFGGGPSFIVHPSDTAPALVALNASFVINGPDGERSLLAKDFFTLPSQNPQRENVLEEGELLSAVSIPAAAANTVSSYYKLMDREAWTHAEVSVAAVLSMDGNRVQAASIVLGGVATVPWKLQAVEDFLLGKQLTATVAQEAGVLAVANARPLAKNGHKVPMTSAAVEHALLSLASA